MDYSKAFDTVRHSSLMQKLSNLEIPDYLYNWIINYFHDRKHITKFEGMKSTERIISASVVQGSALGPAAFIITASDLHPVHAKNKLVKYADDMYLIVGSSMQYSIPEELDHVASWAAENNLRLNPSKTKEMVVARRALKTTLPPPTVLQV